MSFLMRNVQPIYKCWKYYITNAPFCKLKTQFFCGRPSSIGACFLINTGFNGSRRLSMASSNPPPVQNATRKNPTAGIIIIGDEILKGKTRDVNIHFLSSKLYQLGVDVLKVSVIPDRVDSISEEVALFSKKYTFVLTTGGIGPTHDDVTFEGVAAAFGLKLYHHPVIVDLVKRWFRTDDVNSPAMKLAYIPETAVLNFGEDKATGVKSVYPIVTVENVTVFPGIPHLITKNFDSVSKKLFYREGAGFFDSTLYLSCDEVSIAPILNQVVKAFPHVTFGSYPQLFHSYYNTKITMEALDQQQLQEAEETLRGKLNPKHVVDYITDTISDPLPHIEKLKESNSILKPYIEEAQRILAQCYEKYSPEEICICYNGGKDCLVVLHLTYAFMLQHQTKKPLQAVYVPDANSFLEVKKFVQYSIERYGLDCEIIPGPMKPALANLLNKRASIKAVIMGTRRADPHGESLQFFSPTDGDWPRMVRVNPIINWEYNHIWSYIRGLCLPYCSLYDKGYTSIGSQDNTVPNPALEVTDHVGRVSFLPAYKLRNNELERKGRIKGSL